MNIKMILISGLLIASTPLLAEEAADKPSMPVDTSADSLQWGLGSDIGDIVNGSNGGSNFNINIPITFKALGTQWLVEPRVGYRKSDPNPQATNTETDTNNPVAPFSKDSATDLETGSQRVDTRTGVSTSSSFSLSAFNPSLHTTESKTTDIGIGLFAIKNKGNISLYYGALVGVADTSENQEGQTIVTTKSVGTRNDSTHYQRTVVTDKTQTQEIATDATYIAPTLGVAYNFNKNISLGSRSKY